MLGVDLAEYRLLGCLDGWLQPGLALSDPRHNDSNAFIDSTIEDRSGKPNESGKYTRNDAINGTHRHISSACSNAESGPGDDDDSPIPGRSSRHRIS